MESWHRGPRLLHDHPCRISRAPRAVSPSATLAVDAKAKALQAAGRARHRLRGRRAGLPDARGASSRPPQAACRDPRNHQYTPDRRAARALRAAIAAKTRRDSGYAVEPSQVLVTNGGKQAVANAFAMLLRPGRRGARPRPVLDDLPRGDRPGRRGPGGGADRRVDRVPGHRSTELEAARDRAHQGAALRVARPTRPAPSTRRRDRGDRPVGGRARAVGGHRRDLRAPRLRRRRAPLDAGRRPRAGRHAAWSSTGWPRPTP